MSLLGVLRGGRPGTFSLRKSEDVNDVIARRRELCLREQREQAVVAAVTIHDQDFLAAVARHLLHGFLQERELGAQAVGDRSRLLLGFEDLPEVVLGKDHGVFLLNRVQRGEANVEEVSAQREMRTMLFDDAEGKQTDSLRLVNGLHEVGSRELLPLGGEFGLRNRRNHKGEESEHQSGEGRLG